MKLPNAYCVVIPFATKREALIALEQFQSTSYYMGKVIHQYYPEDSRKIRIQKQKKLLENMAKLPQPKSTKLLQHKKYKILPLKSYDG